MDQVKAFLSQVVRFRFWISIGIAVLFSAGAYVLGSGPVQKAAEDEKNKIESAYKDVQQYASSSVPTADFAPIVQAKTEVLTKDVDTAWEALYERQAPLLTWPEAVSERFTKWGRKWPEDVAGTAVQLAIIDYIEAYPAYVDSVFKVFRPFDYETGEGVVASAPKDQLLKVVAFDINKLPKLNEVWSAQERLWVQRTVLEVIADVNRDARDWDTASVKEIKVLEVGSSVAQDQRSLAKGEELEEAEPIVNPDEPEEEEGDMMGGMGGMGSEGMMAMMGPGMAKSAGVGGGAAGKIETAESVFYLKPENATQYKILPVMVTVLVDQERVPDLLVAFENSPMSIEVRDFELQRTTDPVVKPEKGDEFMGYGMMGMGMMGPGMMGGRRGYGGMGSAMMRGMMGEMGGAEGMGMMMPGGMGSAMMRGMGGMGAMAQARKGVDKRGVDRAEKRKEAEKALAEAKKPEPSADLYYNIVEVTVYGQARFYNEPTPEAEEEASPGETAAEADADGTMSAEQPAAEEPKAEAVPEQPAADEAKAEAAPDAPKAEEPKAEEPKAEAAPAEEPKAEGAAPADAETPQQQP